jgi:O-antigen ligase
MDASPAFGQRPLLGVPFLTIPRVAAVSYFLITVTLILYPRATAAMVVVCAIMGLAAYPIRNESLRDAARGNPVLWSVLAFAGLAALSATWTLGNPADAVVKALLAVLIAVATAVACRSLWRDPPAALSAVNAGILAAVVLGCAFIVIELLTNQWLMRRLFEIFPSLTAGYEKHLRYRDGQLAWLSETNSNRRSGIVCLLFWPALLAAGLIEARRARWLVRGALCGLMAVILVFTEHQSSQLSALAGGVVLVLASYAPRAGRALAIAGWCVAVLLIVPLAGTAFQAGLHQKPWMFSTAAQRVVIWGFTSQQVTERPLLGVGADATPTVDARRVTEEIEKIPVSRSDPYGFRTSRHAHNVYLQVWYELGAVGALLFLAIGLTLVRAIGGLSARLQPYGLALFAASAGMIATSYGLWQAWFQAAIAFAVIAFVAAAARDAQRT